MPDGASLLSDGTQNLAYARRSQARFFLVTPGQAKPIQSDRAYPTSPRLNPLSPSESKAKHHSMAAVVTRELAFADRDVPVEAYYPRSAHIKPVLMKSLADPSADINASSIYCSRTDRRPRESVAGPGPTKVELRHPA